MGVDTLPSWVPWPPGVELPEKPAQPNPADALLTVTAPQTLARFRQATHTLFDHFVSGGTRDGLGLAGWMAFLDAFDVCPGYLTTERCEGCFDEALSRAQAPKRSESLGGMVLAVGPQRRDCGGSGARRHLREGAREPSD